MSGFQQAMLCASHAAAAAPKQSQAPLVEFAISAGEKSVTLLYDFFRSSSCYRVRIALNLKGVEYERKVINFRHHEQSQEEFLRVNPQGLVPALLIDGLTLTQSLAIIDYLDATRNGPRLIPRGPVERARVLALSLAIACDIHPIDNLRVLERLRQAHQAQDEQIRDWYVHWVQSGLAALERQLAGIPLSPFLGEFPGLFEICLVPQLYNARRYDVDLSPYPVLVRLDSAARALPAFEAAAPERFAPAA